MSRIIGNETLLDIMMKMVDGNTGAITVLTRIFVNSEKIDPDNAMGGIGSILLLDTFEIYGSRIWMLYKDVCKENLAHTIAIIRAVQLGFLSESALHFAIDNRGSGINLQNIVLDVCDRLPKFNVGG